MVIPLWATGSVNTTLTSPRLVPCSSCAMKCGSQITPALIVQQTSGSSRCESEVRSRYGSFRVWARQCFNDSLTLSLGGCLLGPFGVRATFLLGCCLWQTLVLSCEASVTPRFVLFELCNTQPHHWLLTRLKEFPKWWRGPHIVKGLMVSVLIQKHPLSSLHLSSDLYTSAWASSLVSQTCCAFVQCTNASTLGSSHWVPIKTHIRVYTCS